MTTLPTPIDIANKRAIETVYLVKVTDVYGNKYNLDSRELAGTRTLLRVYQNNGGRRMLGHTDKDMSLHRENIASKQEAQ